MVLAAGYKVVMVNIVRGQQSMEKKPVTLWDIRKPELRKRDKSQETIYKVRR